MSKRQELKGRKEKRKHRKQLRKKAKRKRGLGEGEPIQRGETQRAGEVRGQWVRREIAKSCSNSWVQSGILRRNVFVRLTSPRCRPHHTQQQASQHRKHIKTAIWAPPTPNWIQRAMQHDRCGWTRTLRLFPITQLTNVKQDHKRLCSSSLSAHINNKSFLLLPFQAKI